MKALESYKIKVLKSDDFDKLFGGHRRVKESAGIADPEDKIAYIRQTGNESYDDDTLHHELGELLNPEGSHAVLIGDKTLYCKSFFSKLGNIAKNYVAPIALGLIPGVGPVLAGLYSGINNYQTSGNLGQAALSGVLSGAGSALGQGSTGYKAAVDASKAAGGGILGQTLSGGQGILQQAVGSLPSFGQGGANAGITKALTPGAVGSLGNQLGVMTNTVGQIGSNIDKITAPGFVPATSAGALLNNALGATNNVSLSGGAPTGMNISGVNTGTGLAASGNPAAPASKTLIEQAKGLVNVPNVLGATSILGSMAAPQPQFEMPSTVEDIRKKLLEQTQVDPVTGEMKQGGLTEVGKQAQLELGNILKSTPQELYAPNKDAYYQAALRRTKTSYEEAKKNLDAAYNIAGVYGSGEHLAAQDKLAQQLTNAEADLFAQTEQRNFEFAQNQKYQAIQTALGVDKDTMDDILGLTALDVESAARAYGAKVEDVKQIREAMGTLGVELILRGTTGAGKQPTINFALGK